MLHLILNIILFGGFSMLAYKNLKDGRKMLGVACVLMAISNGMNVFL